MNYIKIYEGLYGNLIEYSNALNGLINAEVTGFGSAVKRMYHNCVLGTFLDFSAERTTYEFIKLLDPDFAREFKEEFLGKYRVIDLIVLNLHNAYEGLYTIFKSQINILLDKTGQACLSNLLEGSKGDHEKHRSISVDNNLFNELYDGRSRLSVKLNKKDYYVLIENIDRLRVTKEKPGEEDCEINKVNKLLSNEQVEQLKCILADHNQAGEFIFKSFPREIRDEMREVMESVSLKPVIKDPPYFM